MADLPETPATRWPRPAIRNTVSFVAVFLGVFGMWEGYKATGLTWPIATDDLSLPHVWRIVGGLLEPARRGANESLGLYLLGEASVTLREALYGLALGATIGLVLAVLLAEVGLVRRGLLPWLVVSQTVPLVAIAPMVVIWGGKVGLPAWTAVTGISAYLSFLPVTINALRGLESTPIIQLELMRTCGARRLQTLWWLRFPAALPHLLSGLKLAATASVVGAIVGEISAGSGRGIGRSILTFTYYYANGPEKLYGAVAIAAVAGVLFVQTLNLVEALTLRHRDRSSR
ncbi:ABC transporter permease subunit [Actinopolymorpha sp. B17G11]|uniref:ABC transporter permease n=1 Tax=Actinopolymorpha sp. B17G11 TaxID=3160861 RepID=UPI0032E4B9BE